MLTWLGERASAGARGKNGKETSENGKGKVEKVFACVGTGDLVVANSMHYAYIIST